MKVIRLVKITNILFFLFLVACNRQMENDKLLSWIRQIKDEKEDVMYIIIRNYTDDTIYVDSYIGLGSIDYIKQEKIYYCSTPIYFVNISHDEYYFMNAINSYDNNEIRIITSSIIDYEKYRYELNNDGRVSKIYEGECNIISFRLFYTKIPLRGHGYKDYVDTMKTHGYYAVGYRDSDKIFFDIHDHTKINDDLPN